MYERIAVFLLGVVIGIGLMLIWYRPRLYRLIQEADTLEAKWRQNRADFEALFSEYSPEFQERWRQRRRGRNSVN